MKQHLQPCVVIAVVVVGAALAPNRAVSGVSPPDALPADIADVPAEDRTVPGEEQMRYFLIGPVEDVPAPEAGYTLVVVLPGGDGSADFHPFVRRIFKYSLGEGYIVAQPVAFKWQPEQRITWPTNRNRVPRQGFTTETFVASVIEDVASVHPVNRDRVFTFSWSSGGPAAYAISMDPDVPVTGSFIMASVFHPGRLPLEAARGHAYYLYHSPDDRVCPYRMALDARERLEAHGAQVTLQTYDGGHGFVGGGHYQAIREGMRWLEEHVEETPVAEMAAESPQ